MSKNGMRFDEIGKKIQRETNPSSMGRSHTLPPPTGILNTVTPCAACKLLRRKCAEECPFSQYFSPHEPQKFAVVHKVFGASNVSKMLMEVPESQRADTANSLVYEANLRLRDPVYGCMGAISALQQQIQSLQAELTAVRTEILKYKMREATSNLIPLPSHHLPVTLVSSGAVSIAEPSSLLPSPSVVAPPPPPPPPPRPPPPSVVVSSTSSNSASASSLYTPTTSCTTGFSSTSSGNVTYFH